MRGWTTVLLLILTVTGTAPRASSQTLPPAAPEILRLKDAVSIAMVGNRPVVAAVLDVEKAKADVCILKTRRLPSTEGTFYGSQLLTPIQFLFREGSFGEFRPSDPSTSAYALHSALRPW